MLICRVDVHRARATALLMPHSLVFRLPLVEPGIKELLVVLHFQVTDL